MVSYNIVGALFSVAENRWGGKSGHVMEGDGGTVCLSGWSDRRVGEPRSVGSFYLGSDCARHGFGRRGRGEGGGSGHTGRSTARAESMLQYVIHY